MPQVYVIKITHDLFNKTCSSELSLVVKYFSVKYSLFNNDIFNFLDQRLLISTKLSQWFRNHDNPPTTSFSSHCFLFQIFYKHNIQFGLARNLLYLLFPVKLTFSVPLLVIFILTSVEISQKPHKNGE